MRFLAILASVLVVLASSACKPESKSSTTGTAQPTSNTVTHNANGATVERFALRMPILSQSGIIVSVVRIRNVPAARHIVFYLPCDAQGSCQAQPIPGERRSVVDQLGDVITIDNTSPDTTTMKRWVPPPDEGIVIN